MIRPVLGLIMLSMVLTACKSPAPVLPGTTPPTLASTMTPTQAGAPGLTPLSAVTQTPFLTETPVRVPTSSMTPTLVDTATPTFTITPTWTFHPPGVVIAPILLYHHIAEAVKKSRYYVSPDVFKAQMEELAASGYTTISMATVVEVMKTGGVLPARPVVITFDDGNLDVYQNAFPVMKALGFTGTVYIVTKALNDPKYMNLDVLKELARAGWEVGSHTKTHSNLTKSVEGLKEELYQSRIDLENLLGIPVKSIAYPFGITDAYILKKAGGYGYESGAGLGWGSEHTPNSALYLTRIEVRESYSLGKLGSLLPWWEGPLDVASTSTLIGH